MNMKAEHPPQIAAKLTPMMAQYMRIKEEAGDSLLFYRMGDFYELFFSDAELAAEALSITLTRRGQHDGQDIPMCGVPVHARDTYLARLVRAGFTVAICEQTEDPAEAKKRGSKSVVARAITRIVTPGTLTEEALLEPREPNHLAAVHRKNGRVAVAAVELSTGEVVIEEGAEAALPSLLAPLALKEIVHPEGDDASAPGTVRASGMDPRCFREASARARIRETYGATEAEGLGLRNALEIETLGGLLGYLALTQLGEQPCLRAPRVGALASAMQIDEATRRSLELTETQNGGRRGSLLAVIDRTVSAGGARLLRQWMTQPLLDVDAINTRQDGVQFLLTDDDLRTDLTLVLRDAPDLARAFSRIALGRGAPSDLGLVRRAVTAARGLASRLGEAGPLPSILEPCAGDAEPELERRLTDALADELPTRKGEGGFIREGFDPELDRVRTLRQSARNMVIALEERYRSATSIKTLRVKYDKTLGYCVEVGKAQADKLSAFDGFTQRRTLTAAARFATEELTELNREVMNAEGAAEERERALFGELTAEVLERGDALAALADKLALADVLCGLASLAHDEDYVRPAVDGSTAFAVEGARHPVVESALRRERQNFVPNDCALSDGGDGAIQLVTGPNMAGKSTYLRQNAILAILAQMGSFVPARRARIGIVDRLFSRVGASDDLAQGRSTFMVEMVETAAILHQATEHSFVILDEVGRGTATYDGLSIAWAALEHLHTESRCRGLFATHYHELTRLCDELPRLVPVAMSAREWRGQVVFLHEVKPGAADRSYGVAVARLAGLPDNVLKRAEQVLGLLEAQSPAGGLVADLPLFAQDTDAPKEEADPLKAALADLDPDDLSPREAHDLLRQLKDLAG
jgi:DNA mismatch repair protein MutS